MLVDCKHKETCSGCRHLGTVLQQQHAAKSEHLQGLLESSGLIAPPVAIVSPGASGLRDRVDLVVENGRLGLYAKTERVIVDIEECAQLSAPLQTWLSEVRRIAWPIQKGSIRLRVGPQGLRGIWLDFANVDIKKILDEKEWLLALQKKAFVEIGQRHKVPVFENEVFKLRDPVPQPWFQTKISDATIDLYSTIAAFTQPSLRANIDIVRIIDGWLQQVKAKNILEFGSGIGNLSFAALGKDRQLTACEIDERSLEGFRKSLDVLSAQTEFSNIKERVEIVRGDFQNKNSQDFGQFDTVLVNPPRSGLKQFLSRLLGEPENFIYMSCYPQSFVEDGIVLQKAGYAISEITILDQFPQTDHYEVLSLWAKA